eukprot:CAMPEP_0115384446 /NCGR_PEP_ID=MMETSP0271-20121206/7112_1 /TAXON_ID=71861 /ORGANISM="Scrippsiella trochoidea, Strain CCMP3099" /LENGTH=48 /DNA_ID= /DNA_START= /DNA_END= /DNA_ORIENTATION=
MRFRSGAAIAPAWEVVGLSSPLFPASARASASAFRLFRQAHKEPKGLV